MRATEWRRACSTNGAMMDAMRSVDSEPLWSILDGKGTQTMMKQLLGEAGSVTDFETVQQRLQASWYSMNFQHGVKFDLTISTGDSFTAATVSSLLTAAVMLRKMSGSDTEKQALSATSIGSDSGRLSIHFATTDGQFSQPAAVAAVPEHGALKRLLFNVSDRPEVIQRTRAQWPPSLRTHFEPFGICRYKSPNVRFIAYTRAVPGLPYPGRIHARSPPTDGRVYVVKSLHGIPLLKPL